ncbi:hypothetical protein [Streptomyces sp. NPDC020965]|uniref:hypothetical protein n=1 Tax=Streptomyces sp. NPDC020965 TaxID=3365105 RepID=UPI0037BD96D8
MVPTVPRVEPVEHGAQFGRIAGDLGRDQGQRTLRVLAITERHDMLGPVLVARAHRAEQSQRGEQFPAARPW